jgi:hypothetical protein
VQLVKSRVLIGPSIREPVVLLVLPVIAPDEHLHVLHFSPLDKNGRPEISGRPFELLCFSAD